MATRTATTSQPANDGTPNDAATRIAARTLRYLSTLRPLAAGDTPAQRLAERSLRRLRTITTPGTPPADG